MTGLRAISELAGMSRILVHMDERSFRTPDGIDALPARGACRSACEAYGSIYPRRCVEASSNRTFPASLS